MPKKTALTIAAGVVGSFAALVGVIVVLSRTGTVSVTVAKLMLVALLGLYFGFGVLIAVYRLIRRLE
jgi:ABC-type uncharacterized transport system fused permease/ATPase subunit